MARENEGLLSMTLNLAVTLRIMRLQERGGPTEDDWLDTQDYARVLGEPENAEALLFKSKYEGLTAVMFNGLAETIAVMSYVPGGITIFGQHYETKQEVTHG